MSPALTVLRDLASFLIGGWALLHQALQPKPDTGVLLIFAGLLVTPGVLAAHWLATSGTAGQSSQPPSPPPQSSSPLPPPG
ncbi:hypothetical protein, partial [Micromonospora harpali]